MGFLLVGIEPRIGAQLERLEDVFATRE